MINRKLLTTIFLLAVMLVLPQGAWADQISGDATVQAFGSSFTTSWMVSDTNKGLTNKVKTGSTVTLDGIVMTFGGTDNAWDYSNSDGQALITDMPNNNGTGVTSISNGTAIPTHGGVYTFAASKTGSITIYGSEAGSASDVYFGEISDGKASGTVSFAKSNTTPSRTFSVEAGKNYFFFQGARNTTTISSNRYSFKGISFNIAEEVVVSGTKVWNFIEEPSIWANRTYYGNYDDLTIRGSVTFDSGNGRYQIAGGAVGSLSFRVNTNGYLVIHGKGNSDKGFTYTKEGSAATTIFNSGSTKGGVYSVKITASSSTKITITSRESYQAHIFSISWIPENSDQDNATQSVTLDSKGYATYYPRYNVTIPDDANLSGVYYLTGKADGKVTPSAAMTGSIPGTTPVFLVGEANATITFTHNDKSALAALSDGNSAAAPAGNTIQKLHGSYKSNLTLDGASSSTYTYYGYVKNEGKFGRVTADVVIPEGKCYLRLPYEAAGARSFLDLDFTESGTTAISDVRSQMSDVRGDFFDLQGRKVAQPTKGLYIVNGKKVIIK